MARYYENTTTFNFSWDQVARGYWKRYPNPQRYLLAYLYNNKYTEKLQYYITILYLLYFVYIFSTHVLSEDTWSRQVKNGCLYTKRLLTKTNRVPKWGERYVLCT